MCNHIYAPLPKQLYRSFLAVVAEGSLSGAARALATTQPTVGRHIEALEGALGIPLFTRSQHGLKPNAAALGLAPHAEAMAAAAAAAALLRCASGEAQEAAGTVRLTASEMVGGEVLPAMTAPLEQLRRAIGAAFTLIAFHAVRTAGRPAGAPTLVLQCRLSPILDSIMRNQHIHCTVAAASIAAAGTRMPGLKTKKRLLR